MPSKSPEQAKLMRAVDHGWHMPGGGGPSKAVAHEFVQADKAADNYASGGLVMSKVDRHNNARFASGGAAIGSTSRFHKTEKLPSKDREFLKESNPYNTDGHDEGWPDKDTPERQDYLSHGRKDCIHDDCDKSLKPVMPRG